MAAACVARKIPFYAALNVTGPARFIPPHRADAWVTRGFLRDQARDKGFGGRALGHAAPAAIARARIAPPICPPPITASRRMGDPSVALIVMGALCPRARLRDVRRTDCRSPVAALPSRHGRRIIAILGPRVSRKSG
jgi:hypothetical protein